MASGTRAPRWTEDEFDRLGDLILQYVSDGKTVMDACYAFQEETNGLRTVSSSRYKFATKVLQRIKAEYEVAKQLGAQKAIEHRTEQREQKPRNRVRRTLKRLDLDGDTPLVLTKNDLIKFIRNAQIIDESAISQSSEFERLRDELDQVKRENSELKNKNTLLQSKYDELNSEHDVLLNAFNVARKAATNAPDPSGFSFTRDKDGLINVRGK